MVNKTDICFDYSNNSIFYRYEFQGLYYDNCINGNLINNETINYCQCNNEKCLSCPDKPLVENLLCAQCNNDYYEIENDNNNTYGYKRCYKDPPGYYLDKDQIEHIYKKCYYSCEKCEIKGNNITHNCKKCNNENPVEVKINNYSNCYHNCSYYYYFDTNNNYLCTLNDICPDDYPIKEGRECKKSNEIKQLLENLISNKSIIEEEIDYYDAILKNIEDLYTSNKYDTSNLDEGNDEIIEMEKLKVTLTTSENQKNNLNSNMTNIDLGECENSLKQFYNLQDNDLLYIKMLEVSQEGMRIPKVEYDIYAKINEGNLTKLNLNICQNNKISILIPVDNVDNIDKLNTKSGYYNDFCYTATSDSGTDISLKDRKNEYPSKAVCQDDCDFVGYNDVTKKAKCSCIAKKSSSSFADMKIDKKKIIR